MKLPHPIAPLNIAERKKEANLILDIFEPIKDHYSKIVVVGTGGSSLGAKTLVQMARLNGVCDKEFCFVEAPNSTCLQEIMEQKDFSETLFIFISKSGKTLETYALAEYILDTLERGRQDIHAFVITEFTDNPLYRLAVKYSLELLPHPQDVGGRYSLFTLVGMLPAYLAGLDIRAILAGSTLYQKAFAAGKLGLLEKSTQWHLDNYRRGKTQCVMVTYEPRLESFVDWWRQLWAESLGKNRFFTTPIKAVGPVDQHSQLQMWMEGSDSQYYMFFNMAQKHSASFGAMQTDDFSFLANKQLHDISNALYRSTVESLKQVGKPVFSYSFARMDEKMIGALFTHFMLETVAIARSLDVDAFDQPGVELGKKLAREYLQAA